MFFLFTCKYEEDPIKNEGASVLANEIIHRFFRRSIAGNSAVLGLIRPKFVLILAFMLVLNCFLHE